MTIRVLDGRDMADAWSPRPVYHPVSTIGGVVVTDVAPTDHPWHRGVGVAVPKVAGVNFWGGGTYRRGVGYEDLPDHGRQVLRGVATGDRGELRMDVEWQRPDGTALIREVRTAAVREPGDGSARILTMTTVLTPCVPDVVAESPGSAGRPGAGYGGWFWRLAPCAALTVATPSSRGEDVANGSTAPWVCVAGTFEAGDATVLFVADASSDRWFVRAAEYPAVGRALAWRDPLDVGAGIERTMTCVIADGRRTPAELLGELT